MVVGAFIVGACGGGAATGPLSASQAPSAAATTAASATRGPDVAIGLQTPLSAPGAVTLGQQIQRGAELGVEYVNTVMGGVLGGRKLVMYTEDTQGQPETAVAGYRRLVTEKKVAATFGYVHSSALLAVNEVAKDLGVPTISSQASAADITKKGYPIAFRTHLIDPMRASAWLQLIKQKGWKKIAIIAEDTDYGVGLVNETKTQSQAMGLNLDLQVNVVDRTAVDMTPQLLKMKDFKPDLILEIASAKQKDQIIDQAYQIGLYPAVPMLNSNDEPTATNFWDNHPKSGVGLMTIATYSPKQPLSDAAQWMADKYKAKYNEAAIYASLNGFGDVIILAQALNNAKSTDSKALISALETGSFKGWTNTPVTFPKAEGVYWHNWSPPVLILQFTAEKQDWREAPILISASK
ncbi:MAG TPA: ABC transporter substrate-binding protein [Candidatus Limnocylindria bacterium]|nr:ABC transporter substrate-binding protein [Candidatus Limnocylindria bacterium]